MSIELTPRQLKLVEQVLRDRFSSNTRKVNKTLLLLVDNGIGHSNGKTITYFDSDYEALHQLIQSNQRADNFVTPSELARAEDRLETAQYSRNEKYNRTHVFGKRIQAVALNTTLTLNHNGVTEVMPATPRGVLPTIEAGCIDATEIKRLIIIENGQLMTHWHHWYHLLPKSWQQSVLIFRGFDDNVAMVYEIVGSLPATAQLGLFFDLDLSGLRLMQSYINRSQCQHYAFLPSLNFANSNCSKSSYLESNFSESMATSIANYTQPHLFAKQQTSTSQQTLQDLHPVLQQYYAYLSAQQLALTQEHLIQDSQLEFTMIKLAK